MESEKAVDNGCRCGPVACFVLPVVGTHQYLSFFSGGWVFSLRLCVHTRLVVRRLSDLRCVGSFFACVWGEKLGVAVLSARATTQIRGGVCRTYRRRVLSRRRSYFQAMTCLGTYSIGTEPGGCDGERIKTVLRVETKESRHIRARQHWEVSGFPTPANDRCHHRRVTLRD